jgi:sortase A
MKKALSWILILVGAGVLLYPTIQSRYYSYKQDQLISSWEESFMVVDSIETDTEISMEFSIDEEQISVLSDLQGITVNTPVNPDETPANLDTDEPSETDAAETINDDAQEKAEVKAIEKATYIEENMEGILIIDKIDFKQPIIRGATAKNMLLTVTSFDSSAYPGEIGNYAIIGHRNLTYGRNFNRLGEVEIGDKAVVITDKGRFVYQITEIFLVLPDDVGVLFGTKLEKRLTLITCDPMGNPTHRLILRGKIIE